KITHSLSLLVDSYGNVEQQINIAYRRCNVEERLSAQAKDYIKLSTYDFINIDQKSKYQSGIIYQHKEYEINYLAYNTDGLLKLNDIKSRVNSLIQEAADYEQNIHPTTHNEMARLLFWECNYYWSSDLENSLPLGIIEQPVLVHHVET